MSVISLRSIIEANPDLFYQNNRGWYETDAFYSAPHSPLSAMPSQLTDYPPEECGFLPWASTLAQLYVQVPGHPFWRRDLWTADFDDFGNRVYVGCIGREGIDTFQIHRYLSGNGIVTPVWEA